MIIQFQKGHFSMFNCDWIDAMDSFGKGISCEGLDSNTRFLEETVLSNVTCGLISNTMDVRLVLLILKDVQETSHRRGDLFILARTLRLQALIYCMQVCCLFLIMNVCVYVFNMFLFPSFSFSS